MSNMVSFESLEQGKNILSPIFLSPIFSGEFKTMKDFDFPLRTLRLCGEKVLIF